MHTLPQPSAPLKIGEMAIRLYQPSLSEICETAAPLRQRWPDLCSRLDKAEQLLADGGLTIEAAAWWHSQVVYWWVSSQRDVGHHYIVGSLLACSCPDTLRPARGARPDPIGNVTYCKHTLAVALYRRILKQRFNQDIQQLNLELGLLHTGEYLIHPTEPGERMGYAQALKEASGEYAFCDARSSIHYALWLERRLQTAWLIDTSKVGLAEPEIVEVTA